MKHILSYNDYFLTEAIQLYKSNTKDHVMRLIYNQPLKNEDKIVVYHGFNDIKDAFIVSDHGLSGKDNIDRWYSYEKYMNPKGLFVSPSFITAESFAYSGVIIEFVVKYQDLDVPIWGKKYNSDKDRERHQKILKDEILNDVTIIDRIKKSDRPDLAYSLTFSGEPQALFVGNLNPNMIRAFWVMNGKIIGANDLHQGNWNPYLWNRYSLNEFKKLRSNINTRSINNFERDYHKVYKYRLLYPTQIPTKETINKAFATNKKRMFTTTIDNSKFWNLVKQAKKTPSKANDLLDKYLFPDQIEYILNNPID